MLEGTVLRLHSSGVKLDYFTNSMKPKFYNAIFISKNMWVFKKCFHVAMFQGSPLSPFWWNVQKLAS